MKNKGVKSMVLVMLMLIFTFEFCVGNVIASDDFKAFANCEESYIQDWDLEIEEEEACTIDMLGGKNGVSRQQIIAGDEKQECGEKLFICMLCIQDCLFLKKIFANDTYASKNLIRGDIHLITNYIHKSDGKKRV